MEFRPEVLSVVANRELSWRGRIPGIFTGEHRFALERTGENGTRFVQRSTFTGLATRFFRGDFVEGMRRGFEAMEGEAIFLGIDRHGTQAEFVGGAEDTDGDFAAVGREEFSNGLGFLHAYAPVRAVRAIQNSTLFLGKNHAARKL